MPLRPSLTVALLAVSDEVAELRRRGERPVHVWHGVEFGSVWLITGSTDSTLPPVAIFGFTDEEAP